MNNIEELKNQIYNEDCIEFMQKLPNECVDLIIADPPYYKINSKATFDYLWESQKDYLLWCKRWLLNSFKVLKNNGSIFIYGAKPMIFEIYNIIKDIGFNFHNEIVWYYATGVPSKKNFRIENENILFLTKGEGRDINYDDIRIPYETKDKRHNKKGKSLGTVWRASRIKPNYKIYTGHPDQKPLELSENMIKGLTNEKDIVFIPFAGSGSEIVSCIKNNREWIATEIDNTYIEDIIKPRIEKINKYKEVNNIENTYNLIS